MRNRRYSRISASDGDGKKEIMEAKDQARKSVTERRVVGNKEYLATMYCTHDDKRT